MTETSILLTNVTINDDECESRKKDGEKGKVIYKRRLNIYSKEKNVKEFKFITNGYHNYCGCKKGLDIAELDVVRIEKNPDVLEIYSYEIKRSDNIRLPAEIQMMKQSLLFTAIATYGYRIHLKNSCIYLDTSRGMVKILVKPVNGSSEGDFKKLPSREMINELENRVTKIFSDIDIYFNESLNAFDVDFKIHLRSGIHVYRFYIPIDVRNVYLETIREYGEKIASEIIMSRGKKDLSYLLAVYSYITLKKLGLEHLSFW